MSNEGVMVKLGPNHAEAMTSLLIHCQRPDRLRNKPTTALKPIKQAPSETAKFFCHLLPWLFQLHAALCQAICTKTFCKCNYYLRWVHVLEVAKKGRLSHEPGKPSTFLGILLYSLIIPPFKVNTFRIAQKPASKGPGQGWSLPAPLAGPKRIVPQCPLGPFNHFDEIENNFWASRYLKICKRAANHTSYLYSQKEAHKSKELFAQKQCTKHQHPHDKAISNESE